MNVFRVTSDKERQLLYKDTLKGILTEKWIKQQLRILYKKSQLKEKAKFLNLLHPHIRDYIDIQTAIRKAEILGHELVLAGQGLVNTVEVGRNLYELKGLYNEEKLRGRLQEKKLFDDVCWELEVAMCLKYSGFDVKFVKESDELSYDIAASYNGDVIAIECKNKHQDDEDYRANQAFASCFVDKNIIDLWGNYAHKRFDIRVTIVKETGSLEDVKNVACVIRKTILDNDSISYYKDKYRIEVLTEYEGLPTPLIMEKQNEEMCVNARSVDSLKEVYDKSKNDGTNYEDRIFFRFPPPDLELKNAKGLISKANKQINGIQGCVFLKVPMINFQETVKEVEYIILENFKNIGAIKIISLQNSFNDKTGVVIERKEKLVIHPSPNIKISTPIIECLSQNILFNKYRGTMGVASTLLTEHE